MKVERITIIFNGIRLKTFDIPKFRGYLSSEYENYTLIHNHLNNGRLRYAYPVIQFKVVDSHPTIIGIGEGIEILKTVFLEVNKIDIDGMRHIIHEKSVMMDSVDFGQTDRPVSYRFLLPWMALNQKNYQEYTILTRSEKRSFLENILRGNLKSLSKGFDYFIPDFDKLHVRSKLKPTRRNFKNRRMLCFNGTFSTNFFIPDYLGIGKQTARGFGTVVRIHTEIDSPFRQRTK